MKYLKIKNDGLLDVRLIQLMGGTTKSDDSFKIGQFGTGLKYTLAYLLRNNIFFKIFVDGLPVDVRTEKEVIRDTDFEVIYINGERSSITTNMGQDWEAWMIIRELWCNALDEENPVNEVVTELISEKGTTEYYIQLVPDIQKVVDHWGTIFIHDKQPLFENDKFKVYEGSNKLRFYKQGVLIHTTNQKSVFSYDIKNARLNELREMQHSCSYHITDILPVLDSRSVDFFLTNLKGTFEDAMDYDWHSSDYGEGWKEAIGNGKIVDYQTYDVLVDKRPEIANEAVIQVPKGLFKKLVKQFKNISFVRASDTLNEFYEVYSDTLHDKVTRAKKTLESVGYFIDPNLKIIYGVFGDKRTIAQVSIDEKEIRMCQELEKKSDFEVITALIEENEHFVTGFYDCSRAFQQHFIDLYANLLLKDVNVLI